MLRRLIVQSKRSVSQLASSVNKGSVNVSPAQGSIQFSFDGGNVKYSYTNAFLRDASESQTSLDGNTGQKLFTTGEIGDVFPVELGVVNDSSVKVKWSDGDEYVYSKEFLEKHSTRESQFRGRYHEDLVTLWDPSDESKYPQLPHYDYHDYINTRETLAQVVRDMHKFGLAVIGNIPDLSAEEQDKQLLVSKIGGRIGYIRPTFYGYTFDVKSKPGATNIAYTSKFLPLHHDLCYYQSPPGLQLLHCIRNRATGGENVFADSFAAAKHVAKVDPAAYEALKTVPINFHFNRDGHHYFHSHPLVVERQFTSQPGFLEEVNYSPPFQAPYDYGLEPNTKESEIFQDFLRGMKLFEDFINDPLNKVKFKTDEGTCVIFDNRRVLHARDEFDPQSGERWLKGCYLDKDAFQSKVRAVELGDY